jgi:hypothetical protein
MVRVGAGSQSDVEIDDTIAWNRNDLDLAEATSPVAMSARRRSSTRSRSNRSPGLNRAMVRHGRR